MIGRWVLIPVLVVLTPLAIWAGELVNFAGFADSLLAQRSLRGTSWSIQFYSLSGDSVIYSKDAERRLTPASVSKLFTTAAAMDCLGPDYRLSTRFSTSAPIGTDGVLFGDLIVDAGGDPSAGIKRVKGTGVPLLWAWADSLRDRGLFRVKGNLRLRTRPYVLEPESPAWEVGDVEAGFAPAADGFGFNSNVCHLGVFPGNFVGATPLLQVDPPFAPVRVDCRATTGSSESSAWLKLSPVPDDTAIVLYGEIPLGDDGEYLWVPVQNPATYFGRALLDALKRTSLLVDGELIVDRGGVASPAEHVLFSAQSAPLTRLLAIVNKESDNYAAEYMLRQVGVAYRGSGDTRSGLDGVMSFLGKIGIPKSSIRLEDGSGLAPRNACSAESVVQLLRAMNTHAARDSFMTSLAVSGTDGTISGRLGDRCTGRVLAKTGTHSNVSTLAGYAFCENGDLVAFALLFNNFNGSPTAVRRVQDQLLQALIEASP